MSRADYAGVAERLESASLDPSVDYPAIMALLGYNAGAHARLGWACRRYGASAWQSMPDFSSADSADLWVGRGAGYWNDVGRNADGSFFAGFQHPDFGNDYADGKTLGAAMWAAWLRLVAKVPSE